MLREFRTSFVVRALADVLDLLIYSVNAQGVSHVLCGSGVCGRTRSFDLLLPAAVPRLQTRLQTGVRSGWGRPRTARASGRTASSAAFQPDVLSGPVPG